LSVPLNQIIHADCLDILNELPDNSIDLILTDPPYKLSQRYGSGIDADNLMAVSSILQTMPEFGRVLKEGRFAVVFYDNRILPLMFQALKGTDLTYKRSIFLYRRWGLSHLWMGWMQCTDPICFFMKGSEKSFKAKVKGKAKHDFYIKKGPEKENTGHPAQKPLEILKDIITWCSDENDVVLDPYSGSGSTCLASKMLNRKYIGIDNKKEYVEMAIERINNYTPQPLLESYDSSKASI